ncbi:50S ribosomal protein L21 [bacterium]|nr:50S ribosomal protein L21 [bacterium]
MKFAIVETGGKQYRVEEGKTLRVEKLGLKEDEKARFDKVLLVANGEKVDIGMPYLSGTSVSLEHIKEGRSAKVTVIQYKQKSRYFKKKGHRQPFSEVKVGKIQSK